MAEKKRILIIDDEREIADLLKVRLEMANYEVLTANDGQEGLDRARSDKPDLILLDVMMPKLNGYQACRELKNSESTKNIPVMILTAKTQDSDKFWGKEVGADDFITKPFESSNLLKKVKGLLK
ncbi:MAG: response regulator [Pseudomonadota bacterium]